MMDKFKKVPEIRFEGFDDEWEIIKFHNVGNFYSGGTPLSSNPDYYNGNIPFIRSGEINKNKTELYLSEEGLISSSARLVEVGDVLLALYGATSGEISISKINGAINQAILAIIPNKNFSNYFIKNYFVIKKDEINTKYLQGGQKNLSGKIIKSIDCRFPVNDEQTQIGNFFKNLDEKLELEKEKHEKLINYKKAMLEDMFPKEGEKVPKVRFNDFDDEWEEYKIGNMLKYEQPASYIVKSDKYKSSGTPVLTANKAFVLGYTNEGNVYNKGNCIIFDDFTMDFKYVDFDFKVKSSALKILTSQSHFLYFIYVLLYVQNFVSKTHRRHYIGYVQKLDVLIPSPKEQSLIGNFFKNLDEKIELSEKKIAKIEDFKKAMLEKMFV